MSEDFLSSYLNYASDTEVPAVYNRWTAITSIGAYLGRRYSFQHGHFAVNPNIYCMLVGNSGTRKSTPIKIFKNLLRAAGYETIAAEKSTKEKFLLDLSGDLTNDNLPTTEDILNSNLWGDDASSKEDAEVFVMADEFNDFFGNGNVEFFSLLGTLWDYTGVYSSRIKTGKSISVNNPTVSILGGNTPTNISMAFPPEIIGQGFFSRMLFIYGEPNGKRITFPKQPSAESTSEIIANLQRIKQSPYGSANLSSTAEKLLEAIYTTDSKLSDPRFDSFSTRRLTHLLKLCLICSAARYAREITESDVIYANTILSHAECYMPKALGEFGKSRNSDVSHKVTSLLSREVRPFSFKEVWKHVSQDLEKMQDLQNLLQNLVLADKIIAVPGSGYISKHVGLDTSFSKYVDYSLLTAEEIGMKL